MKTIVIIGGGFSGTMAAVNLARLADDPLKIVLINSGRTTGRGAAYSTRRGEHLLNVAARNMSAVPDHPGHFVEWLAGRSEYRDFTRHQLRELFAPRRIYGDYLKNLALAYFHPLDEHQPAQIEVVEDEAVDIVNRPDERPIVVLAGGMTVDADQVLLATGNQPPALLLGSSGPFEHPRYVADPWTDWEIRLPDAQADVLLLGTGLTTIDAFLTLKARGWRGRMIALSRQGLLPQSHFVGIEYPDYIADEIESLSLTAAVRLVEHHWRKLTEMRQNGAIAIDKLRPHTQRLWRRFSKSEKRTFLKKYASRWNVARHRIAESIARQVGDALATGQLTLVRGRIDHLSADGERITVHLEDEAGNMTEVSGGFAINCTGPQSSFSQAPSTLLQNLLKRGDIRPDELDLGVAVTDDFEVIDGNDEVSSWLFAMGPLLKGTLWETIAVPELRVQALRVAQTMLNATTVPEVREEYVIEYCI